MVFDLVYKLGRKALSAGLYAGISGSFLGRDKAWKRIETYAEIFRYYAGAGLDFRGRTAIEVGCGDQVYTALYLLRAGADRVLLAEPKLRLSPEKVAASLEHFVRHTGQAWQGDPPGPRIQGYRDLREIPPALDGKADLLLSHLVLEHFSGLEDYFRQNARLLAPAGLSHNRVDLSDHTYHVFGKYPFLAGFAGRRSLYHLRYSDAAFGRVNDPKCYMNRRLLPEYLALAAAHGLEVSKLAKRRAPLARIHRDLLARHPGCDREDLEVVEFALELRKAGTTPSLR